MRRASDSPRSRAHGRPRLRRGRNVHRAPVFVHCERTTGRGPFEQLVEQVMSQKPYASAQRVFWVVDNGSSHRGARCERRLAGSWPSIRLVHDPGVLAQLGRALLQRRSAQGARTERVALVGRARGCPPRLTKEGPALRCGFPAALDRHVPADQLAAQIVRRTLARGAGRAAPTRNATLVGKVGNVTRVLGWVAVATMTPTVAVRPMLAGAARRSRRRPQDGCWKRAWCLHLVSLPHHHTAVGRATAGGVDSPPPVK
jgi:hypothetical protein